MTRHHNPIFEQLCRMGVCSPSAVEHFRDGVRDRDDVSVLRCAKSGALFLDRVDHIDITHYDAKPPTHTFGAEKRQIITTGDDTRRRYHDFASLVRGRSWIDVGSGSGAMLDVFAPIVSSYCAVEPQEVAAAFLRDLGHPVYRRLSDVPFQHYQVATLFHVYEHLSDPIGVLEELRQRLAPGADLIIEVPHARDLLISLARNENFCAHTFWSEHLFLHTRETLTALVRAAGFDVVSIQGVQRYPVANHLYWLTKGKPAGHVEWSMLVDERLDTAYEAVLAGLDMTDTLVLRGKKNS
jgi:SAM-dependent methyltransferase